MWGQNFLSKKDSDVAAKKAEAKQAEEDARKLEAESKAKQDEAEQAASSAARSADADADGAEKAKAAEKQAAEVNEKAVKKQAEARKKQKEAEEAEPFVISGTVFKLAVSIGDDSSSGAMAPVFVLALALGSAFATGFSLVPSDGGEDDHEDHH